MSTLYVVSTPIGNLGDLTRRAGEILAAVSRVLAEDTRRTRTLMTHLQLRTPLVSLHAHNEAEREKAILGWLSAGEDLALVSDAGTPLVSDPGHRVVAAVVRAGFPVVPVPGPSAVLAALVGSGFPADRFTFLGFLPRKGGERSELLDRISTAPETTVLFESPERVRSLLENLEEVCGADRAVAVARELTKLHEEFVRGPLKEVQEELKVRDPRGEFVVVVSPGPGGEAEDSVDQAAARALAVGLLEQGLAPSQAARDVARRLGVARNLAYQVVQDVARERPVGGGGGTRDAPRDVEPPDPDSPGSSRDHG
jgi:16S rRNA (cytidine1402-2'-O)-methyltransferase